MQINEKEYGRILKDCEFILQERNALLTFSFKTVIAMLIPAFAVEADRVTIFLFLTPFFVIIPFTARITYYRLWEAHLHAYLIQTESYSADYYYASDTDVNINLGRSIDSVIAWLINNEMLLISICCMFIFYFKYPVFILEFSLYDCLICVIPILACSLVYKIIKSAYDYNNIKLKYIKAWNRHFNK